MLLACAKLAVMVLGCPEWLLGHCKVVARWLWCFLVVAMVLRIVVRTSKSVNLQIVARWLLWCFGWLLGFSRWLLEHAKVFTCKLFARWWLWRFGGLGGC